MTKIITAVASLPIDRRSSIRTSAAFSSVLALPAWGSGDDSPLLANKQAVLEKQITECMTKTGVPGAAVSLMNTHNSIQQVAGVRELGKSPKVSAVLGDESKGLTKASYERLHRAIPGAEFGYALGWATDGKDEQGRGDFEVHGFTGMISVT
jgi:hypothetical protein